MSRLGNILSWSCMALCLCLGFAAGAWWNWHTEPDEGRGGAQTEPLSDLGQTGARPEEDVPPAVLTPRSTLPPGSPVPCPNLLLSLPGVAVAGGQRPELLIDGNKTRYDGGEGYAFTNWQASPPEAFLITWRQSQPANTVRILLWDGDQRFYRYRLEASAQAQGEDWVVLSDQTGANCQCRSWQTISFGRRPLRRLRLTGTFNSANTYFHVVEVEVYNLPPEASPPWDSTEF